jgi:hypothetical protein
MPSAVVSLLLSVAKDKIEKWVLFLAHVSSGRYYTADTIT